MIIDISTKKPAVVLAALYNAAKKSMMEKESQSQSTPLPLTHQLLTTDEAMEIINHSGNDIDRLNDIPLHIDLSYTHLDVTRYDSIYGECYAKKAIESYQGDGSQRESQGDGSKTE